MKIRKNTKYIVLSLLILTVICVILLVVYNNNITKISAMEELPNYTEIKGNYDVKELKYEKQPHLGNRDAKVNVIEYADFKCPACKKWKDANWERFKNEFIDTGKVQLFFINYAFIDRDSILAASAGEAIAKQDNSKFWEYYEKLYDHQGDETKIWATQDFILDFVKSNINNIDYALFEKDLKEHKYMLDVKEDYKTAGHYGVNGTPQFMVNGVLLPDSSYEALATAIENQLSGTSF
ncbi:protein-disulfide isomerase [Paenibacillus forsythiae]|uniref:Protein-disulfide isomerase n=1 Tax=Paenibacillus forsythiae TaxID=365616 RepID=A0ABU3H5W2_9BACL|nr:thioredoxin domain-containing protein [Paenibacillus forsythiae]MDT3426125.1 protein-disulfide isomerase [Paenibacillus forsythiae]